MPKIERNCSNCGKLLILNSYEAKTENSFCDRSCAATHNNKKTRKRKLSTKCRSCSQPIYAGYTYCKPCYAKRSLLDKTLGEVIQNRKNDSNRYGSIREHGRKIYLTADMPLTCKICNYFKHIEICHIRDISDFPLTTKISEVNSLDNLVALCRNHHWEFDHDLLDDEDLTILKNPILWGSSVFMAGEKELSEKELKKFQKELNLPDLF